MTFVEKVKVIDAAKVAIVDAVKYRCEKCGWATRDKKEFEEHKCRQKS